MQHIETMTSRQRVLAAINHQQPDRMPIDLGMHFSTGISAFAYWHLREYLGLSTDNIEVADQVQFLARVEEDVLERLHCDCILLKPSPASSGTFQPRAPYRFAVPDTFRPTRNEQGDWVATGIDNKTMRMPAGGYFFDGEWPDFSDRTFDNELRATAANARRIHDETAYFTMYQSLTGFFDQSVDMMMRMYDEPEALVAEMDALLITETEKAGRIITAMGDTIQGVCTGADLGSQQGPMLDPDMYGEFFAPYLKKLCDFIHRNADYKIFYHCCGSIKPFLPMLIDCGIDIINPVQHSAENMEPAVLKREFGKSLTFWGGGVDCQHVLGFGSEAEIRQNVRENCAVFKPDGGFVFNPIHNIMGDVPPEKIMAVYDEAYKNSFYDVK